MTRTEDPELSIPFEVELIALARKLQTDAGVLIRELGLFEAQVGEYTPDSLLPDQAVGYHFAMQSFQLDLARFYQMHKDRRKAAHDREVARDAEMPL